MSPLFVRSRSRRVAIAMFTLLVTSQAGFAQDSSRTRLGEVIVTATRSNTTKRDIPQKVDVITRNDIESTPATDVADLLKRLSTIDIIQYPSISAGVAIRGYRPELSGLNRRTMILIDGRSAGAASLAALPLNNVERIEVLKGASSALYGANAMGGVINIITRQTQGPIQTHITAQYGSFQTSDLTARVGGNITPALDFDANIRDFNQRDDYRIGGNGIFRRWLGRETATKLFPDGTTEDVPDANNGMVRHGASYNARSGGARLGYALGGGMRIDVSGEGFRANNVRVPGDIAQVDTGNSIKNMSRYSYEVSISGRRGNHEPRLRFFTTNDKGSNYNDTTPTRFINFQDEATTFGFQLQNVTYLGRHNLTYGIDYISGKANSRRFSDDTTRVAPYSPDSKNASLGAFVQAQWSALDGKLNGTLGGRLDHLTLTLLETPYMPEVSAGKTSVTTFNPSAGAQYWITSTMRIHSSIGRAFVMPTPYSMAGMSTFHPSVNEVTFTTGNPNLKPESSITYDLGIGLAPARSGVTADITYFQTHVSNRITTARATFPEGSRPTTAEGEEVRQVQTSVNASTATMHGFEFEGGYDFGALAQHKYILRMFTNMTRMFSSYERIKAASVNVDDFAGESDFNPSDVLNAFIFGTEQKTKVRNVSPMTITTGLEFNDLSRWSGRMTWRYVGRRLDLDFSTTGSSDIMYAPFAVLDLVVGATVLPGYRVDVLVNNLTNENYYEKRGYNQPGRNIHLRLSFAR